MSAMLSISGFRHVVQLSVVAVTALLLVSCNGAGTTEGEGKGEDEPFDPDGCETDDECFQDAPVCDKTNDGDNIPAAFDAAGVCAVRECLCNGVLVDCVVAVRCTEQLFRCDDDDDCDDGDVCGFTEGQSRCEQPRTIASSRLLLSRTVALAGETITVLAWSHDSVGRVVPNAPVDVVAACDTGVCEQRIEASGTVGSLRVHAQATARQLIVADTLGAPVSDAQVRTIAGDDVVTGVTDANGVFVYDDAVDTLSVSAEGYEGHSFAAPVDNVLVVLRPLQRVVVGAVVTFDMTAMESVGDLKFSITNAPLNGDPSAFSLTDVFGRSSAVTVDFDIATPDGPEVIGVFDGSMLRLGATDFRAGGIVVADASPGDMLLVWTLASSFQLSRLDRAFSDGVPARDFLFELARIADGTFEHDFVAVDGLTPTAYSPAADVDLDGLADGPPTSDAFGATTTTPRTRMVHSTTLPEVEAGIIGVVGVEVPGLGLLPLGVREATRTLGTAEVLLKSAPAHDGLEKLPTKTLFATYDERPWSAAAPVRLRTGETFAPEAEGDVSVVDNAVVIGGVAGVSLLQVRIAGDGFAWNFWSRGSARFGLDTTITGEVPATYTATAIAHRRDDDTASAQIVDGQMTHVTALTRTAIPVPPP